MRGNSTVNLYTLLDYFVIHRTSSATGKKTFLDRSTDSKNFNKHLQVVKFLKSPITKADKIEISTKTLAEQLSTGLWKARCKGFDVQTIIYQYRRIKHPFDTSKFAKNSFNNFLLKEKYFDNFNLIAMRTLVLNCTTSEYIYIMNNLNYFFAMTAVSIKLIGTLIIHYKPWIKSTIIVVGISPGSGFPNLYYTHCNSAEAYIQMMIGTVLDDIFIPSVFRKLTREEALKNSDILGDILNLENAFLSVASNNIFHLLALYGQIIRHNRQLKCYYNIYVNILGK